MQQGSGYQLKIIHNDIEDGVVFYTIQVVSIQKKKTWQFKDRYKNMLTMHNTISAQAKTIPKFPPKKLFGNKDPEFVSQRKAELQNYFKNLLQHVDVDQIEVLKTFLLRGKGKEIQDADQQKNVQENNNRPSNQVAQGAKNPAQEKKNKRKEEFEKIANDTNQKFIDLAFAMNSPVENEMKKKEFLYGQIKLDPKYAEPTKYQLNINPSANVQSGNPTLVEQQPEFFSKLVKFANEINKIIEV